jgi:cytochrome o ubiquinol oxidase subunit 2
MRVNKKTKVIVFVLLLLGFLALVGWYLARTNIPVLEPAGPIGRQERGLIVITLLLSLVVVVPVFTLLFAFSWRYRESNTKAKYSPEMDHSRLAETVWWLVPSALILILGTIIWRSSYQLDPYKPLISRVQPITIQVVALDWKWLFIYPQQNIATVNFVQFPTHTPVDFQITADAPMNSFWIPQLGGQIYAMPGMSTELHLLADRNGNFHGSSANISGQGFAGMDFTAKASSAAAFQQWVSQVKDSSVNLDLNQYGKLAQPSENNPPTYYASSQVGLYDDVILKYMSPLTNKQNLDTL